MYALTQDTTIARGLTPLLILVATFFWYRFLHAASERLRERDAHRPAIIGGVILGLSIAFALKMWLAPPPYAGDGQAILIFVLLAASILIGIASVLFGVIRIVRYRQHWADALGWGSWEAVGTLSGGIAVFYVLQMLLFRIMMLLTGLTHG